MNRIVKSKTAKLQSRLSEIRADDDADLFMNPPIARRMRDD